MDKMIFDADSVGECVTWKMPIVSNVENSFMKQQKIILQQQQELSNENSQEKAFEKGFNEGMQKAQQTIAEKMAELQKALDLLNRPLEMAEKELELQILKLTQLTAQACLKAELTINPDKILHIISELVSHLGASTRMIYVHCSNDDYTTIQHAVSSDHVQMKNIKLVRDSQCQRGECILKRDDVILTSSVNAMLGNLASELLKDDAAQNFDIKSEQTLSENNPQETQQDDTVNDPAGHPGPAGSARHESL